MRVALTLLLLAGVAAADTAVDTAQIATLHMRSPSHVVTSGGSQLDLPAGYFLPESTYDKLNTEVLRLQDVETRLTAENKTLRADVATWQPGFYVLATTFVVGLATGVYFYYKVK